MVQSHWANCKILFSLLSNRGNEILDELGTVFKYEVAVGFNGKVWVKAADHVTTIILANALAKAQLPAKEFQMLVQRLKSL